jgi:hypothetical protein
MYYFYTIPRLRSIAQDYFKDIYKQENKERKLLEKTQNKIKQKRTKRIRIDVP